eukprot:Partr_v1_DN27830_c2_g1_i2_m23282 putative Catalyzes the hydroxylation of L-kynurenine (L-Kyn) to form 3-hydroxy-L-kynurenine (L-3OHKyn). Required for synthesis of quinolinic acid
MSTALPNTLRAISVADSFSPAVSAASTANQHAVVVGAGPGGLLAAINLLRLGFRVTLVERGPDLADLDAFKSTKSWMIGLSNFGITALQDIPELWAIVEKLVIKVEKFQLFIMGGCRNVPVTTSVIDRNRIVSALSKYISDTYASKGVFASMYDTQLLNVDGDQQELIIKDLPSGQMSSVSYDLLVGADGLRSMVRNSLFSQYHKFEVAQSSIFLILRSIYIECPENLPYAAMHIVADQLKNCNIMLIPAPNNKMNFLFSVAENVVVDDALISSDPAVIGKYLEENLTAFKISEEECKELAAARWYQTGQVTCNMYHLPVGRGSALITGDAAHATSPSMGMGLNTALYDSKVLYDIFKENNNDLTKCLPEFSRIRVKEGRALTELSFYMNALAQGDRIFNEIKNGLRSLGHKLTFGYIAKPARELPAQGVPLSEVHRIARQQGQLEVNRLKNNAIVRSYWEQEFGMIPDTEESIKAREQNKIMTAYDITKLRQVSKKNKDITIEEDAVSATVNATPAVESAETSIPAMPVKTLPAAVDVEEIETTQDLTVESEYLKAESEEKPVTGR